MHNTIQPADRLKRIQADRKQLSRRLLANDRIPAELTGWLYSDLLALEVEIAFLDGSPSREDLEMWEATIAGITWLLADEKQLEANFHGVYLRLFYPETADDQIRRFRRLAGY